MDTSKAVKETVKTISTLTKGDLRIYDITQGLGNKLKDDSRTIITYGPT